MASGHLGPRSLGKLLEAVISLGSELDLGSVLRRIVETGVELTGARFGGLGVLDEQGSSLAQFITVGVDDETRRRIGPPPKGLGLLGALIDDARPLRVADLSEYPGRSGFPAGHPPMTSFLGVPISIRDKVFGNLYLTDKQSGEVFTDVDEELMLSLATAAGAAIDNARLFDQLRRREAALSAIQDVARSVLEGADSGEILRFVAERARVLAGADVATFALPAPDGETLVMEVADGPLGADLAGQRFRRAGSVSGEVLASGRTALFADLSSDNHVVQPQVRMAKIGPAIYTPLSAGDQRLGTLFVGRALGAAPFGDPDVEMVRSFAAQASVVLDSAAQKQRLDRMILLEEQERIARDLHDTVIQQVFAVGLALNGAAHVAGEHPVGPRIIAAVDDLDKVIRQIRTVVFAVDPASTSSGSSLRTDLLAQIRQVSRILGFEPAVTFSGPVDTVVGGDLAQTASATVREALSNIARHARASRTEISVSVTGDALTIRVIDDGVGIGADAGRSGGRGLGNMRSRAEVHGGRLEVSPGPDGSGTVIDWVVPLG